MSNTLLTCKYSHGDDDRQQNFRKRNKIAPTFHGPVFVVEDVWVTCGRCQTPVDPVTRIPVGRLFYHPACLRCIICQKPSKGQIFKAQKGHPVCQDCSNVGYKVTNEVLKQERQALEGRQSRTSFNGTRGSSASPNVAAAFSLRSLGTLSATPSRPLALPPVPSPGKRTQSPSTGSRPGSTLSPVRGCTERSQQLLDRQTAVYQNDANIILALPAPPTSKYSVLKEQAAVMMPVTRLL
jgi:hypothetical protein